LGIIRRCYPSIVDLDKVKKLNWCRFVVDQLKEAANRMHKRNSVKGCLLFIVVPYVDSLSVGNLEISSDKPRIAAWSKKLLDDVIKLDTNSYGSFGKLRCDANVEASDEDEVPLIMPLRSSQTGINKGEARTKESEEKGLLTQEIALDVVPPPASKYGHTQSQRQQLRIPSGPTVAAATTATSSNVVGANDTNTSIKTQECSMKPPDDLAKEPNGCHGSKESMPAKDTAPHMHRDNPMAFTPPEINIMKFIYDDIEDTSKKQPEPSCDAPTSNKKRVEDEAIQIIEEGKGKLATASASTSNQDI
ncbi:hypothetical protein BAE44_0006487, partial [Dichanthelium oligosanthes]